MSTSDQIENKAHAYAAALGGAKRNHLKPGWFERVFFKARPRALRFERYSPSDWSGDHPVGQPLLSELILPEGLKRQDCGDVESVFAYVYRPANRELVIMDLAAPRLGVCFSLRFDDSSGEFVNHRGLWIS